MFLDGDTDILVEVRYAMSDYLKIDSHRLQQASNRYSSSAGAPSDRDINDFERAMQRPDEQREAGSE